jgi:hypothetical protein
MSRASAKLPLIDRDARFVARDKDRETENLMPPFSTGDRFPVSRYFANFRVAFWGRRYIFTPSNTSWGTLLRSGISSELLADHQTWI